ncbi:hypothetical protein IMZ48_02375 [Candidatus Bathyarchaeota archaeon]|nr:hypothetical protein [Candidatus Bathyarchaeota archaeon]
MSGSTDMSTSLRSQSSNVGGGMRPGHVGNISANLYSNVDTLSSSAGHFEGPSSPYGFANSANRAVRPMHMMGNFGGMGEAAGSPIIGTPTSPFGRMDFAAPQVTSPVQSPPTDPFGELANFGTSMGHNPAASPFDTMSPGGRVTTPMQPSAGAGTYRDAGMHGTEDTFVGSHADHFQGLDPFNSMGSINQHVTHQFGDMSAAASMETWGDLGVFAKEEPSSEPTQFDAISPAPRNNDMAQTPMQTSMNFTGQGYFGSQPPQPPPQMPQQQPRQQPQLPPRSRPRPVPSQPPARPAKKPFLRQQDTAGEGSTPGFNIWKPPVPSTPKPAIGHIQQRSSAMSPTSNVPFLPLSQSDVKAEPGITLSSQQYDADMRVTSPNTAMPSSVASPMRDTPSVSSPVRPPFVLLSSCYLTNRLGGRIPLLYLYDPNREPDRRGSRCPPKRGKP